MAATSTVHRAVFSSKAPQTTPVRSLCCGFACKPTMRTREPSLSVGAASAVDCESGTFGVRDIRTCVPFNGGSVASFFVEEGDGVDSPRDSPDAVADAGSARTTSMSAGAETQGAARLADTKRAADIDCGCFGARVLPNTISTAVKIKPSGTAAETCLASSCRMQPAHHSVRCMSKRQNASQTAVHAKAAPSPSSTSSSADASLHILWGGRQSSRFTSAIVPLGATSITNSREPSPREFRTVTCTA